MSFKMFNVINMFKIDQLSIVKAENRADLGQKSAAAVADKIHNLLQQKESINMIFAAAPSQVEFLENLVSNPAIDWSRIRGFHMDEYIGLHKENPVLFSQFLKKHLFSKVAFKRVNFLQSSIDSIENECHRYAGMLTTNPPDIVCMGIGENGHIAFNDPHVADFKDPQLVKSVELDEDCRNQQVNDGCFKRLEDVPSQAITLTIPMLMRGAHLFCMVPGARKRMALYQTLKGEISADWPASILRTHSCAALFGDADSLVDF